MADQGRQAGVGPPQKSASQRHLQGGNRDATQTKNRARKLEYFGTKYKQVQEYTPVTEMYTRIPPFPENIQEKKHFTKKNHKTYLHLCVREDV